MVYEVVINNGSGQIVSVTTLNPLHVFTAYNAGSNHKTDVFVDGRQTSLDKVYEDGLSTRN